MDFSDRIDGRRRSYRTSHRRRRKDANEDKDELGDSTDDDEIGSESIQRKIARLVREGEELKAEIARRRQANEKQGDLAYEDTSDKESMDQLSIALEGLSSLEPDGAMSAESRLAQKLNSSLRALRPITTSSTQPQENQQPNSSYTITYAPTFNQDHDLAKTIDFDERLSQLETTLGIDTLPLPTESNSFPKPILPALDLLDRQISLITSMTPSSLNVMTKHTQQLILEAEKLTEARKAARAAREEEALASPPPKYGHGSSKSSTTLPVPPVEDPEETAKINALFATLPTIERLAPLLPPLLDRLQSLRLIHADAATASESLARVERRQAEMGEELRVWGEGLSQIETMIKGGEEKVRGNMKTVETWVKELEERVKSLRKGEEVP